MHYLALKPPGQSSRWQAGIREQCVVTDLVVADCFSGSILGSLKSGTVMQAARSWRGRRLKPGSRLFGLTCGLEDIDAAAATTEKAGAEIVQPLMKIPEYEKFATYMQGGIHHGLW